MRTFNKTTLLRAGEFIKEYQMDNGWSPNYRKDMSGVGMSSLNLVQRYSIRQVINALFR